MTEEMSITMPETLEGFGVEAGGGEPPADGEVSGRRRRGPRALWGSLDGGTRTAALVVSVVVALFATLVGAVYGTVAVSQHNARVAAVETARSLDGQTLFVHDITFNWFGETDLYLRDEAGRELPPVSMAHNNPLTGELHPLYVVLARKNTRLPVKVRAHFRPDPWVLKIYESEKTYDTFAGSFIEFERLDLKEAEEARAAAGGPRIRTPAPDMIAGGPENVTDKPLRLFAPGDTLYVQRWEARERRNYLCRFVAVWRGRVVVEVETPALFGQHIKGERLSVRPAECYVWGRDRNPTARQRWFGGLKTPAAPRPRPLV